MTRAQRYEAVLGYFREHSPAVTTELEHSNAFELLCAVVLSAQCTDKRVNTVTPALFAKYPTPAKMAAAAEEDVLALVGSVSYPNSKARHLVQLAARLQEAYGGEVPQGMADLTSLPGVGRKTANVMQAVWFGTAAMPVDTHVYRVSRRLGLVPATDDTPLKVERTLTRNIPREDLAKAHHWLLLHGRYVCTSRTARCTECPFCTFCPKKTENSKLAR